ncbi:ATP-dependent RNA helicase DbpA [Maribrevibacterium harenarium]|uniref:ATP-dependent RNA helicase DbpA n=1 Tax=Maribrevibacterium harenarium TaxID=2589817 RepID=A0A501WV59_9GAMM|nr:ATP-dependent RNA helicase DbpA [Maribrevibacterium harenarium]TPE51267.1 ATP-dependent RNA helicase DbpA [Maribrevibacterium harenarium]
MSLSADPIYQSLINPLQRILDDFGFTAFTPVQQQSLPLLLKNRDVIAQAQTGSGKTLAFALGLLTRIDTQQRHTQALVLCPTRELADQVAKEIRKLARYIDNLKVLTLCGGMPFGPQLASLEHGAHVVVGTPGRIMEHLRKGTLQTDRLSVLVLDEADRMLDMGFVDSIRDVVALTPKTRQTLLFSATYEDNVAELREEFQRDAEFIEIAKVAELQPDIQQYFLSTNPENKFQQLLDTLSHFEPQQAIVFCHTKADTQDTADLLQAHNLSALALHGDLDQKQRDQVFVRFANKSCCILVATDVAARGIDVKDLDMVISYDTSRDVDVHTHRVGRTGRAGAKGIAVNFVSEKEAYKVEAISTRFNTEPEWLTLKPNPSAQIFAPMVTIAFDAGRKNKLRAGDILGTLTAGIGLEKAQVGKIDIFDFHAYVAIERDVAKSTLKALQQRKIKGRVIKSRILR